MEQKKGGSSHVANTEVWVTKNSANTKSRIMENSANTESQVTENLVNTEKRVMQDSRGKKPEDGKGPAPSKRLAPRWCPRGIISTVGPSQPGFTIAPCVDSYEPKI
jgi:hypothetical protein